MFRVSFGNPKTLGIWIEEFPSYTAAWIAYLSYRDEPTPTKQSVRFLA